MLHCFEIGVIGTGMSRFVRFLWRGLVQHLSLLQADGEAEVLGCIREEVGDVLQSFLRVGEKGAVVSKQQLSDEFLDGFCACEETPKDEHAAVCSETDVDTVWQVLPSLTEHDAEEDGEQCRSRTPPLLMPLEMGKPPDSDPLCFT